MDCDWSHHSIFNLTLHKAEPFYFHRVVFSEQYLLLLIPFLFFSRFPSGLVHTTVSLSSVTFLLVQCLSLTFVFVPCSFRLGNCPPREKRRPLLVKKLSIRSLNSLGLTLRFLSRTFNSSYPSTSSPSFSRSLFFLRSQLLPNNRPEPLCLNVSRLVV